MAHPADPGPHRAERGGDRTLHPGTERERSQVGLRQPVRLVRDRGPRAVRRRERRLRPVRRQKLCPRGQPTQRGHPARDRRTRLEAGEVVPVVGPDGPKGHRISPGRQRGRSVLQCHAREPRTAPLYPARRHCHLRARDQSRQPDRQPGHHHRQLHHDADHGHGQQAQRRFSAGTAD